MKYDKINLMVPTWGRVVNGMLPRFVESAATLADNIDKIHFSFLIDPGDKQSSYYITKLAHTGLKVDLFVSDFEQPHVAKCYNRLYELSIQDPSMLISMVGDDMEWKTKGYDSKILDKANECKGKAIIYCDDDFVQHEKMCVNLFTTRLLVDATGQPFMCPKFRANIIDSIWTSIGRKADLLQYMPDIILKHHHKDRDENRVRMSTYVSFESQHAGFIDEYSDLIAIALTEKGLIGGKKRTIRKKFTAKRSA
jgi:hypothetical protein